MEVKLNVFSDFKEIAEGLAKKLNLDFYSKSDYTIVITDRNEVFLVHSEHKDLKSIWKEATDLGGFLVTGLASTNSRMIIPMNIVIGLHQFNPTDSRTTTGVTRSSAFTANDCLPDDFLGF